MSLGVADDGDARLQGRDKGGGHSDTGRCRAEEVLLGWRNKNVSEEMCTVVNEERLYFLIPFELHLELHIQCLSI